MPGRDPQVSAPEHGDRSVRATPKYVRRVGGWSISVLAPLLAAGYSPTTVLNGLVWRHGFEITRSVAYGEGPRRTLDVYRPSAAAASPVVIFFYGGSWQSGSKEMYLFVAAALAQRGYLTLVPDYRVYPEVRYPGFIEDGALAVQWAKQHAARFGGDPEKLFVMGHSAGAYIAAMLAIDEGWLQAIGLAPHQDITGLIGISGPYDFLPLKSDILKAIFGGANRTETQPIAYVCGGEPPALLLAGSADDTVDPGNTHRLAEALHAAGNDVKAVAYAGVGHLATVGAFAWPLRFIAPVLPDVDSFIAARADLNSRVPNR
jgi:acetyl esterase/lipase